MGISPEQALRFRDINTAYNLGVEHGAEQQHSNPHGVDTLEQEEQWEAYEDGYLVGEESLEV